MSSIGDRMKTYEAVTQFTLTRRTPVIIRLDGRSFHSFSKRFSKPFSESLIGMMDYAAKNLVRDIQGAKLAYVQSDEISVLVSDYDDIYQEPWFGYKLSKICSISSSIVTGSFLKAYVTESGGDFPDKLPQFDSRAFCIPENDVNNYFVWRQRDWIRNSIQMVARSKYSHKELQGVKTNGLLEMCPEWNELRSHLKYGRVLDTKGNLLEETPLFFKNHEYCKDLLL